MLALSDELLLPLREQRMSERITASQLMDTLMSDPEFVRREQEREAQRMKAAGTLAEAEAGQVRELRGSGMNVDSVWGLGGWKGDNDATLRAESGTRTAAE